MSDSDERGFHYMLEPAWRRAGHRHDVALATLGRKLKALEDGRAPMQALASLCAALARRLTPAVASVVDPLRASQGALHLGHLQQRLSDARAEVRSLEAAVEGARLEVASSRAAVEAFDAHRQAALDEHRQILEHRLQAEADQNWLSRRHWQLSTHKPHAASMPSTEGDHL